MAVVIRKRKSTISIVSYSLSRITGSTMAWVLFILGIISLNATVIAATMIMKKNDVAGFKVNIQYAIIIFVNVFLFLFTVMNVVKLYSDQLADGSFLLLVSKPYKRLSIFMCQFTAIWIAQIVFILISLSSTLLTGFALSQIVNISWLFMTLLNLLIQLTIYTLLFSIVTICGAILLAVLLSTQIVFLILVIFCSLFLMGGMPYLLFKEVANSTQLVLLGGAGTSPKIISVREIKKVILFKQKLKKNKIRYQNITEKIFNLFEKNPTLMSLSQSNARNKILIEMLDKDMKVYRSTAFSQIINGKIVAWSGHPSGQPVNGKNVEIKLTYSKYLKNPNDPNAVNRLDPKNVYHKEILGMIKEYEDLGISLYMENNKSSAANLFQLNGADSYMEVKNIDYKDPSSSSGTTHGNLRSFFNGVGDYAIDHGPDWYFGKFGSKITSYDLDRAATEKFNEVYLNPVPYVLNTIASIVADTLRARNEISTMKPSQNSNFKKYESAMSSYQIVNYLNLIEHWNQLWSRLIGEEPFWYDMLEEKFNFESQMNYLLSYEDFPLQFNEKGFIDINKIEYFQNWLYVLIAYLSASMLFLLTSIIVINRKDIT